ncbi:MAG: Sir2 family NAD-dependent protein deacetylase [Caldiserica bacterium]|nr:Sir2 family NAD-dependent protein deacetylase [Caldisericota bacterium]
MMNAQKLARLIQNSHRIVALTGAGISTAAGIPDFRGPNGIYVTHQYDPEKTFDIDWFEMDPHYFFEFARDFLTTIDRIHPTQAHGFLAELEQQGLLRSAITQNIDGLHQKAGSKNVIEVHGSFQQGHCRKCGHSYSCDELKHKILAEGVPHCDRCDGVVKPDIVFYGEAVRGMEEAESEARHADLFLAIGTSLSVYPAATLPTFSGGPVVSINRGTMGELVRGMESIERDIDEVFTEVRTILCPSSR